MEPSDSEQSMEDILASIKQIIAEDGSAAAAHAKPRREPITFGDSPEHATAPEPEAVAAPADPEPEGAGGEAPAEVLELTSPVAAPEPQSLPTVPAPSFADEDTAPAAARDPALVSNDAEVASRHALAALSAMVVKPPMAADNSLEGLVREMLKPMLKDWLDARLPDIVERLVALEISRITARGA